jgi:hypothetical protein
MVIQARRLCLEASTANYDLSALTLVSISGEAPAPGDVRQLYDRICMNICCVITTNACS